MFSIKSWQLLATRTATLPYTLLTPLQLPNPLLAFPRFIKDANPQSNLDFSPSGASIAGSIRPCF